MQTSKLIAMAGLSLWLGAGCATIGTAQTADVLPQGKAQLGIEPMWMGYSVEGESVSTGQLDLVGRFGISEKTEVSGRFGTSLLGLGFKYQFTPPDQDVIISVAPSMSGVVGGGSSGGTSAAAGFLNFQVPVLFGFPVSETAQVVLAPKVLNSVLFAGGTGGGTAGGANVNVLSLGASAGIAVGSPMFKIMPEIAFAQPIYASAGAAGGGEGGSTGGFTDGFRVSRAQFTLAFLIGG